jgi:hypothetical protein
MPGGRVKKRGAELYFDVTILNINKIFFFKKKGRRKEPAGTRVRRQITAYVAALC